MLLSKLPSEKVWIHQKIKISLQKERKKNAWTDQEHEVKR